jgi:hypothetical protein
MTDPRKTTRPGGPEPSVPPPSFDDWNGGGGADGGGGSGYRPPRGFPDLSPLFALIDALRRLVPAELQDQFSALQRELLLTMRALIDWYLERLEARERAPEVEEIRID